MPLPPPTPLHATPARATLHAALHSPPSWIRPRLGLASAVAERVPRPQAAAGEASVAGSSATTSEARPRRGLVPGQRQKVCHEIQLVAGRFNSDDELKEAVDLRAEALRLEARCFANNGNAWWAMARRVRPPSRGLASGGTGTELGIVLLAFAPVETMDHILSESEKARAGLRDERAAVLVTADKLQTLYAERGLTEYESPIDGVSPVAYLYSLQAIGVYKGWIDPSDIPADCAYALMRAATEALGSLTSLSDQERSLGFVRGQQATEHCPPAPLSAQIH